VEKFNPQKFSPQEKPGVKNRGAPPPFFFFEKIGFFLTKAFPGRFGFFLKKTLCFLKFFLHFGWKKTPDLKKKKNFPNKTTFKINGPPFNFFSPFFIFF